MRRRSRIARPGAMAGMDRPAHDAERAAIARRRVAGAAIGLPAEPRGLGCGPLMSASVAPSSVLK